MATSDQNRRNCWIWLGAWLVIGLGAAMAAYLVWHSGDPAESKVVALALAVMALAALSAGASWLGAACAQRSARARWRRCRWALRRAPAANRRAMVSILCSGIGGVVAAAMVPVDANAQEGSDGETDPGQLPELGWVPLGAPESDSQPQPGGAAPSPGQVSLAPSPSVSPGMGQNPSVLASQEAIAQRLAPVRPAELGLSLEAPAKPPFAIAAPPAEGPVSEGLAQGSARVPTTGRWHVVSEGESLWGIAEQVLGPQATNADITAYWPQIHRANQLVIGANPDLIHVGQKLTLPERSSS